MKSAFSFSKKLIKALSITLIFFSIFFGPVGNLYAQAPTITSFSPASGSVGTLVTITGTNLGSPTAFSIGGVSAIVVSNNGTALVGMVMPGAKTGTIFVNTAGGEVVSGSNFTVAPTPYPDAQQGPKLIGTGNSGAAWQGVSVSISADGNTAIVGGPYDNSQQGAAWIYSQSGGVWKQQGGKLVGSGNIGPARQGSSVALSGDGNTAIIGGPVDNSSQGAVWVFTRSSGSWTQQGSKLVGTGNIGAARQGNSVSLSADGTIALVGGFGDNSFQGAAWLYKRIGGNWTQQGAKLVGTNSIGAAQQGDNVSVSADGLTAIVGGPSDNLNQGATWVFTRSGVEWMQQGNKLVGTGGTSNALQGYSVSLSADGNTAIVGGAGDNSFQGAVWVFTRSDGNWTQHGAKLVGTGSSINSQQGISISISADGNTAIVGGSGDNLNQGAFWVFTRVDGIWNQQGAKQVGSGSSNNALQGVSVSVSADGKIAIIGGNRDNSNQGAAWVFKQSSKSTDYFRSIISGNWHDSATWESSPVADFSSGVISPATVSPGADAKGISIRQNHTVTVTQNVYVRQLFVHPSGVVNVIGCILTQIEN